MPENFDLKKEWEKTKKQLIKFSKEAAVVAKKGEQELIKFSKKSKLQLDSTAYNLKKEKLYYLVGKEYVKAIKTGKQTAQLKKYLDELNKINKDQKIIKSKIKNPNGKNGK